MKKILFLSVLSAPIIPVFFVTACSSDGNNSQTKPEVPEIKPPTKPPVEPPIDPPVEPEQPKDYKISFSSKNNFDLGREDLEVQNLDMNFLKSNVLKLKEEIFITNNLPSNFNWEENVQIQEDKINRFPDLGVIEFTIYLYKYENNKNDSINGVIKFTGFKTPQKDLQKELDRINNSNIAFQNPKLDNEDMLFYILDEKHFLNYLNINFNSNFQYTIEELKNDKLSKTISFKIRIYSPHANESKITKLFEIKYSILQSTPSYKIQIINNNTLLGTGKTLTLKSSIDPNVNYLKYQWVVENDKVVLENNSETSSELSFSVDEKIKDVKFILNVLNWNNEKRAQSEIILSFDHTLFDFVFYENKVLTYGENNLDVSDSSINEQWIKEKIIENKEDVIGLNFEEGYYDYEVFNTFDWDKNLEVNILNRNQNIGAITFNLTLKNKNNAGDSTSIKLILNGFNKTMSDDQILRLCYDNLEITTTLTNEQISKMLAKDAVEFENIKKFFSYDDKKYIEELGAEVFLIGEVNPEDSSKIKIKAQISLLTDSSKQMIKEKEFAGFDPYIGDLDKIENKILKTPNGANSYKNRLTLISPNDKIGIDGFKDRVKKINWDQIKKEFVYQARFVLYQSFEDDFSEVNYYVIENSDNSITAVAEGVAARDKNHSFYVQTTGVAQKYSTQIKKGEIIKVAFDIPYTNKNFDGYHVNSLDWSFERSSIDYVNSTTKQFGVAFDAYKMNITKSGNNICSQQENKLRTFSFSIGKLKG